MLSYRHAFHAGNFADLLKHLVQVEILAYLVKKPKPFAYIDTHAGAGMYRLDSTMAQKNREYANGIGRVAGQDISRLPLLDAYLEQIRLCNPQQEDPDSWRYYPGSAKIAQACLRQTDRAYLFELHTKEFSLLKANMQDDKRIAVRQQDGFKALPGLLPVPSRRALVLIDPSYELKEDYQQLFDVVKAAHRKMPATVFALWYPVVERQRIEKLKKQFCKSGIRRIVQFELGITADSVGHGMTSAGMIVINPPWGLFETMEQLLPELARCVSTDGVQHYHCEEWVGE